MTLLRSIFAALASILLTAFFSFIVIACGLFDRFGPLARSMVRVWARLILVVSGIRVDVKGLENIGGGVNYVVTANHQSLMDLPMILGFLPLPVTILAKKELFRIPAFGWAALCSGVLPIDRSHRTKAMETVKKAENILLRESLSLLVFPEGTRTRDGKVGEFKKGPFMISMNTGLPILPVTIKGNFEVLPKGALLIRGGPVQLTIHKPIQTSQYSYEEIQKLMSVTRDSIDMRQ